jgi:hypothetical protein
MTGKVVDWFGLCMLSLAVALVDSLWQKLGHFECREPHTPRSQLLQVAENTDYL